MLIYVLLALCVFGALAWFFQANKTKSERIARAAQFCPCSKLAQTGALSKILTYAAIAVITIDGYTASLMGLNFKQSQEIILSIVLLFLGFKVAKE